MKNTIQTIKFLYPESSILVPGEIDNEITDPWLIEYFIQPMEKLGCKFKSWGTHGDDNYCVTTLIFEVSIGLPLEIPNNLNEPGQPKITFCSYGSILFLFIPTIA